MEKKMNNKGFSMVELIIVIAIMAVLVVVAAPQYLKFVERGRNSTDQNNATAIESAVLVYASDTLATTPYVTDTTGTIIHVKNSAGEVVTGGQNTSQIGTALTDANINITGMKCQSKTKWNNFKIRVKVTAEGQVTVETGYYLDTTFKEGIDVD